jgi:hypothetical protein
MQKIMADVFKKEFGECLVTEELPECRGAKEYPSPNQLKGRIIIKHKKLLAGALEVEKSGHQEDTDISSSKMLGCVFSSSVRDAFASLVCTFSF